MDFLSNNLFESGILPPSLSGQELQRDFEWQIFMPHIIAGIDGVAISQFCQDVKFGPYSMSELSTMKYGAFQRAYAGLQSIKTATFIFLADANNLVSSYFTEWYYQAIDRQGYYHPKNEYAKTMDVLLYSRTGSLSVSYKLQGVFPKNKPNVSVQYTDKGDILRYLIEMNIDQIV